MKTMQFPYTIYFNVNGNFRRGYEKGDLMHADDFGEITISTEAPVLSEELKRAAQEVFRRNNLFGESMRSMSVGDVIQFGEICFTVLPVGWAPVVLDPNDIIHRKETSS